MREHLKFMPDPGEERERGRFIIRFVACFLILSLLEFGAVRIWDSLKKQPEETAAAEIVSPGSDTQDAASGDKSSAAIPISASLLNAIIAYATAKMTDRPQTIGELIRRRCKGRIKYIS